MIRLHKGAALLITKDAEALAEALATGSGRSCIGPRISPTVAWVDHRRLGTLRQALTQAGYTPRMTRDSDEPQDEGQ